MVLPKKKKEKDDNVIFEDSSPQAEASEDVSEEKVEQVPVAPSPPMMSSSGASCLETFPIGFKYCPVCGESYPLDHQIDICNCSDKSALAIADKGFRPGHYLIMYNHAKKAIAYFRLPKTGSVFIGRSSERGSPRDIDVSVAWKHYYHRNVSADEFKQQMRLLKGISRKHALIRYLENEQMYVLFHLSDKNYTVIQMSGAEKRTRAPKNRNRIDLKPGAVILMGNQKDFILMRYKVLSP